MCTIYTLERQSPEAPREYIHSGLVLGLDWAFCQLCSIMYLPCLFEPTQQIVICPHDSHFTHVPSLNIYCRRLNTAIQVNNMDTRHLIYIGHIYIYIHHIIIAVQLLLYTSSMLLGRSAGPDHSYREQESPQNRFCVFFYGGNTHRWALMAKKTSIRSIPIID